MTQAEVFSVKELTRQIKRSLEMNPELQDVWVRGEISNFTHHSRGHMYLTLKDEAAKIKAVMFAGHNRYLKFMPKNGQKVLVRGEVNLYERDGQYQLYIKEMQPDGIGALYQAYEDLKQKLEQRGWFSEENKKPIPILPQKIGVITSPTGAAIRDILITIKRRFPYMEVLIFPVSVQGEYAPASVAKAIQSAQLEEGMDILIVGRGGGSIEELWAFNEEIVAAAIYHSAIPIISAVGHETDYTIADFVADLRAPTPTAAAELSVPHFQELHQRLNHLEQRVKRVLLRKTHENRKELERMLNSYAFKYPHQLIEQKEQQLDQVLHSLNKALQRRLEERRAQIEQLKKQLLRMNPKQKWQEAQDLHSRTNERLMKVIHQQLERKQKNLQFTMSSLDARSPLKIMKKGYSLLYNEDKQKLYKSVKQIEPGQIVRVLMHDGELDCQVWGIKEEKR